jgi:hypothetical protein
MIRNHYILCFVETKTDDLVVINFPDFKFILNNRKNIAYRRSGGIMVGYSEINKWIQLLLGSRNDLFTVISEL